MPEEKKAPDSKIFINGSEIAPDLKADIRESTVSQYVEGPSSFDITVNILNGENQEIKWVDDAIFQLGNSVKIELGYLNEFQTVFEGEITALQPKFSNVGTALLSVQGFDKLHRLGRGKKTRVFSDVSDSQIAERIAGENDLSATIDDSEIVHPYLLQNNLTDLHFLQLRADRIGFELKVSGAQLLFKKKPYHLSGTVALEYPQTLKWFFPRMSVSGAVGKMKVVGWNPETKEQIVGSAQSDALAGSMGGDFGVDISDTVFGERTAVESDVPVVNQTEADQIALGQLQSLALEWIKGDGEAVGNPEIRAGEVITLTGLGNQFSGEYYLDCVEHTVSPEFGFKTNFHAVRNAS